MPQSEARRNPCTAMKIQKLVRLVDHLRGRLARTKDVNRRQETKRLLVSAERIRARLDGQKSAHNGELKSAHNGEFLLSYARNRKAPTDMYQYPLAPCPGSALED